MKNLSRRTKVTVLRWRWIFTNATGFRWNLHKKITLEHMFVIFQRYLELRTFKKLFLRITASMSIFLTNVRQMFLIIQQPLP